jgi:D-mannonate dehydratase
MTHRWPEFAGKARIMNSVENFERLMRLAPSKHNAICFCQGTFAAMGVDIPATIRRLRASHPLRSLSRCARQCRSLCGDISRQRAH